jgi:hypothetical protein
LITIIKYVIIFLVIAFLALGLFGAIREINKHDLSTKKPTVCSTMLKSPVYLITYGQGDAYVANERVLAESSLDKCVDAVVMYRKEHIDEAFYEKNKAILDQPRGAGYWLWKPYFILKTLEQIPEGAILIYLDSGLKIVDSMDAIINRLNGYDMLFFDNIASTHRKYTKRELLKFFDMDNNLVRDSGQINAAVMIFRNTKRSREFVNKWLWIGQIPGLIDDTSSKNEHLDFLDNRHDQSIVSLLYIQDNLGIKLDKSSDLYGTLWHHRRRNIDKSIYILNGASRSFIAQEVQWLLYMTRHLNIK